MLTMRMLPVALCLLAVACGGPPRTPPVSPPDVAPPSGLRLPGDVRPTAYALELEVDPASDTFAGRVVIDADIVEPTQVVWLDAVELDVLDARLTAGGRVIPVRLRGDDRRVGLVLPQTLEPQPIEIEIGYRGRAREAASDGVFRRRAGGDWFAYTQLEAMDARRVFPAFDEPGYKVPLTLTLVVPAGMVAVANTAEVLRATLADGRARVSFATTRPLPSYLLAFSVGPFDIIDAGRHGRADTPVRILVPPGRGDEAAFAIEATGPLLALLEDYVDGPYPYGKLDQVIVPHFGYAMENPGLITYDDEILLLDRNTDSLHRRKLAASIIAHELAHQWFGNLVTMRWWDDIWLNEAFATWMAARTIEAWQPAWDGAIAMEQERASAMQWDGSASVRRVRERIATAHDVKSAFDGTTYDKGASLLRMIERWVGAETFRATVRNYIRAHADHNASSQDFFDALAKTADADAPRVLATFIDQPGMPIVHASLSCQPGDAPTIVLKQERYQSLGAAPVEPQTWAIPVCAAWSAGGERGRTCVVLDEDTGTIPLEGAAQCPDWVNLNDGATGYYVAHYGDDLRDRLIANLGALSVAERVGTLGELHLLQSSGHVSLGDTLRLAPRLVRDADPYVLIAVSALVGIDREMVPEAQLPVYRAQLRAWFGPVARALGWTPRDSDSAAQRSLRTTALYTAVIAGHDETLADDGEALARAWLDDPAAVHPDLMRMVMAVAGRRADDALWAALIDRAAAAETSNESDPYVAALGGTHDPARAEQALALLLRDDIPVMDTVWIPMSFLRRPETREVAWSFLEQNLDAILERLPDSVDEYVLWYPHGLCHRDWLPRVESLYRPRIDAILGGPRALDKALERISQCAAYREHHRAGVVEALGTIRKLEPENTAKSPFRRRP